jgi:hypothetical protein
MMKKSFPILVFLLCVQLLVPAAGSAWYRPYPYPYAWGGCGGGYCGGYSGWDVAGAAIGGALLGVAVTSLIVQASRPAAVVTQGPIYVAPAPVVPNQAYAYPDPAYIERHQPKRAPGAWVTVPGQWVGNRWVPEHRVFVPENP